MDIIIKTIVDKEWEMFSSTQNIGGQASCQQNKAQFEIMRSAQFDNWDAETLAAYLEDLEEAEKAGWNLPTLKYAYMMESTDPAGYAAIAHQLPVHDGEKLQLVEELCRITMDWCEDFARKWPGVALAGRPLYKAADSCFATSVETYSRGEFLSYGNRTLRSLLRHYEDMRAKGINLHERIVESEMRKLGLEGLEAAENFMRKR